MKIVVDIPDQMYERVLDGTYCGTLYEELKNGTPLPKGHGDLIERQKIIDKCDRLIDVEKAQGTDSMNYGKERVASFEVLKWYASCESLVPTIIESDKE